MPSKTPTPVTYTLYASTSKDHFSLVGDGITINGGVRDGAITGEQAAPWARDFLTAAGRAQLAAAVETHGSDRCNSDGVQVEIETIVDVWGDDE